MSLALRPLLAPASAARQLRAAARCRPARPRAVGCARAAGRFVVAALDGKPESTESKTLFNLDAVLGVVDEPPAEEQQVRPAAHKPTRRSASQRLGFRLALFGLAAAAHHPAAVAAVAAPVSARRVARRFSAGSRGPA
jgi:hypothetical protein